MEQFRQDLFTTIHKAIRSMIYETGSILQSVDFRDFREEQAAVKILCDHLKLLKSHGDQENNNILNRLNEYEHEIANIFFNEHRIIDKKYEELTSLIREMLECPVEKKQEYGFRINRGFNDFAAFYFAHMNREEEVAVPATQNYFSDEQLSEMRSNIQNSIPPEILKIWMQYMLPALNNYELSGLFQGIKLSGPAEIRENISQIAEETIGSERWGKIKTEIEMQQQE